MTPEQKQAFMNAAGVGAGGATPSTMSGAHPVHTQSGSSHSQHPKEKPITKGKSSGSEQKPSHNPNPLGIEGPHQKPGTDGAPPAHSAPNYAPVVNDPNQTYSFTDKKGRRVTITTTASGAKMEQVEGHSAYQIKAPDQTPEDPNKPAWHQNANWTAPDANVAAAAHVDANTVLEQRPGADGNVILRMADGTYKNLHPDGSVSDAGTWNKDQWAITNGGTTAPPASQDPNPLGGLTPGDPSNANTPTRAPTPL